MGLAPGSKVTFLLPFDVITESSALVIELLSPLAWPPLIPPRRGFRLGEVGARGHKNGIVGSEAKDDTGGGLGRARRRNTAVANSIQRRCLRPIKPSGPVKHRKPKIANTATNRSVIMRASLRPRFSHPHCRRPDPAREGWSYRSFVKRPFQTSKPIRQNASTSRAISFAHETLELLPRRRKFP